MSASAVAPVAKPTMPKVPLTPFQRHSRGFMAGAICAATTHVIVVPLDVVKTRIQACDNALSSTCVVPAGCGSRFSVHWM